jgi:hypothetical protein
MIKAMILFFLFQQTPPVRVYVFSKPAAAGFVDEARPMSDSVRDLRDNIGDIDKKTGAVKKRSSKLFPMLYLVDTAEEADVTLEVVFSGKTAKTGATVGKRNPFTGDIETEQDTDLVPKLTTVLAVRGTDFQKTFELQDQRFWSNLAWKLLGEINKWVEINAAQIKK